jgi:hypothetical protein
MAGRPPKANPRRALPEINIQVDGDVLESFLHSRNKVDIIQGPVGSGKTLAAINRLFLMASEQIAVKGKRRSRWLVTRPTGPELKTTIVKDFYERFPVEEGWGEWNMTPPITFKMRHGMIEADFVFLALDDESDIRKLKSTQFTGAMINEGQFTSLIMFTQIFERIGRFPPKEYVDGHLMGGARNPCVIMDMNAADESHWVPIMRGDVPMPDWFTQDDVRKHTNRVDPKTGKPIIQFFMQPAALIEIKDSSGMVVDWRVNPEAENLAFLDADYYANKIIGQSKDVIDMTCMNRTGALKGGKPVHIGFNKEVHVAREPLIYRPELELIVGLDFGRTPAAVWGQTWGGRWYILGEYYLEDVSSEQFAPMLKKELSRRCVGLNWDSVRFYGDPSGNFKGQASDITSFQIFRKAGLNVVAATAGLRFDARKEAVDSVLSRMVGGFPGILFDQSCRMITAGLGGGYKWKSVNGRDGSVSINEAVKNKYSHPMDAFQYLLAGSGEVTSVTIGSSAPRRVETRVKSQVFRSDRGSVFRRRA